MAYRGTLHHWKTRVLAARLGIMPCYALGILEALWHVTSDLAPAGNIGRLTNDAIALQMYYDGDADALITALVDSGHVEEDNEHRLMVHDWHQYSYDAVDSRLARSGERYANGTIPRMTKLTKRERVEANAKYGIPQVQDGQTALSGAQQRLTAHDGAQRRPTSTLTKTLTRPELQDKDKEHDSKSHVHVHDSESHALAHDEERRASPPPVAAAASLAPVDSKRNRKDELRDAETVRALFGHYCRLFEVDTTGYTFTRERREAATRRMRERMEVHDGEYSLAVEDLRRAIANLHASEFHRNTHQHDWLDHLFGSRDTFEKRLTWKPPQEVSSNGHESLDQRNQRILRENLARMDTPALDDDVFAASGEPSRQSE